MALLVVHTFRVVRVAFRVMALDTVGDSLLGWASGNRRLAQPVIPPARKKPAFVMKLRRESDGELFCSFSMNTPFLLFLSQLR